MIFPILRDKARAVDGDRRVRDIYSHSSFRVIVGEMKCDWKRHKLSFNSSDFQPDVKFTYL